MPACAKLTKNGPIDYQYDYRSGSNRKARPAAFSVLAGGRKPSCFRGFGVVKWWEYGNNNPVRFVDPDGLDPSGPRGNSGLSFFPISLPYNTPYPEDLSLSPWRIKGVIRNSKNGFLEVVKNLSNDPRFDTNCHGYTFLDGDYWLNPENVRAAILGLGYREIDPVSEEIKVGDKVLYDVPSSKDPNRRDFHSATVVDLYSPGTLVRGISGNEVTPSVTTLKGAVNWSDAIKVHYYRR